MAKLTSEQLKAVQDLYKSGDKEGAIALTNQYAGNATATTPKATTATTTTTPKSNTNTTSTTPTYTQKSEYKGTGSGNSPTVKDTSWDKGNTNYSYNEKSGYYEAPSQTTITEPKDTATKVRNAWNELSYAEQQKRLQANPNLQAQLTKYGATNKTPDAVEKSTAGASDSSKTKNADGTNWDYQDNSPERMKEIADNVDSFAITNPDLFASEDAFRNFFIDGKGRTPEQEKFLMDYYKNRKMYNELDNYTSNDIGNMLAGGKVPDSYITYLKYSDPQRYAEVMDAKAKAEDKIKDNTALDTMNVLSGESEATITSKAIEWLKSQGLFLDNDGNLIDDRTENYASEEENQYAKDAADIIARNLEIDNIVKHTYDDLVERYPGASKATLMAMAQDRNSDLLREKENNNVELTRLQGYMDYMQSERQERNRIGENAINQLQKQYGMYYQYTPQGMSELAQAQYAATNITLDQADNGTDTQKQMALQRVLDDYYAKYGDIIQRSEAQVINDVMALAKNKGISLSQALQENFITPLKNKPEFKTLSSGGTLNADPYVVKVGDVAYRYNPITDEFELIGGGAIGTLGGGTTNGELYGFTNYTPITTEEKETTLSTFMSEHPLNSEGGECGSFVNNYLQSLGYDRLYTDPIDKKKAITNSDTASVGSIAVMDSKKYPQYGHTAIVTDVQGDKVKLLESNWGDDKKVHERRVNKSDILGYFDPSKQPVSSGTNNQNAKFGGSDYWNNNGYSDKLIQEYKAYLTKPDYESKSDLEYKLNQLGMTFDDFTTQAKNYAVTGMKEEGVENASQSLETAIKLYEYIAGDKAEFGGRLNSAQGGPRDTIVAKWFKGTKAHDAYQYYDTLSSRLTLDELIATKKQGATYGAMSEGEWELLKNSATDLDWSSSTGKFQQNLEDLIYSLTQTVQQGGGTLPNNFYGSTASNMLIREGDKGRWDKYHNDNTGSSSSSKGGPSPI